MQPRIPITLVTGPLGSGKTTLLRHILATQREKIAPERIVVETTGLAEPEALVFNIQEALPQCRLDGVVSVIDADMLIRFPELGYTTRLQLEGADILLLNKVDLVNANQIEPLETKLRQINSTAAIVRTERCH